MNQDIDVRIHHQKIHDLVKEYVRLNRPETMRRRAPSGRYINFRSNLRPRTTGQRLAAAIRAWKAVKTMDSPKEYRAFARTRDYGSMG